MLPDAAAVAMSRMRFVALPARPNRVGCKFAIESGASGGSAWFDVRLMHKDIRLALQAARQTNVPLPAASAADRELSLAEQMGYGHRDIAGLFQVLARTAAQPEAPTGPGQPALSGAGAGPRAA
jgi:hypothetical protein